MGRFENPYLTKSPSQNTDEQKPAQKAQQNTAGQNAGSVNVVPIDKETPSTELKSDGSTPYGSLSDALNARAANPSQSEQTKFKAAPEKKDGGFFNWVKSIMPKKRPGKRDGETDDEYDQRRTRNMQMVATFADAIRHIGNIVNTSKGAPLQKFNDTNAMLQEGYEKRKKERAAKAALDADAAEKQASLYLKERAAKADEAYKRMNLYLKKYGMDRQAAKTWLQRNASRRRTSRNRIIGRRILKKRKDIIKRPKQYLHPKERAKAVPAVPERVVASIGLTTRTANVITNPTKRCMSRSSIENMAIIPKAKVPHLPVQSLMTQTVRQP